MQIYYVLCNVRLFKGLKVLCLFFYKTFTKIAGFLWRTTWYCSHHLKNIIKFTGLKVATTPR